MKVVCLGDSFTEGFLVPKSYVGYLEDRGYELVNLGKNGDRTIDLVERFKPTTCDWLIIFAGSNDFNEGISAEMARDNIKTLLEKSLAKHNLLVIPPLVEEDYTYPRFALMNNSINAYGQMLLGLSNHIVDARKIEPSYFIDGIHMREDFHQKLASLIIDIIETNK